jgi:hypothetical protein
MLKRKILIIGFISIFGLTSFIVLIPAQKYKCMLQMNSYEGEGAYVIVSLINPSNEYEKTLYVLGKDDDWYSDITNWWNYYGKKRYDLDGITGATLSGNKSGINIIEIDDYNMNSGYKIRFETAVEDQKYYKTDIEFELTTTSISSKKEGSGYINYVRLMPIN